MPLHSYANFKLVMSRHRKKLRGAVGHGLFGFCGLCVNPSLVATASILMFAMFHVQLGIHRPGSEYVVE